MAKSGRAAALSLGAGSARDMLLATAVAGGAGYAITVAAGALLGHGDYLTFAAFWSALYLVVGALAGVQHETTRAARGTEVPAHPGTPARNIVVATAVATALLLLLPAPLWVPAVFGEHGSGLLAPLVVGALGYLVMAVTGGVLAGLASWRLLAGITIADALLRVVLLAVGLAVTNDVVLLAWCVAVPFGLAGIGAATLLTPVVRGRYQIVEPLGRLAWNAARTVASGAAMGVLITGFPALLKATSAASTADVSSVVFVSSLVRSPLIVLAMAFQVMLVQRLRDARRPMTLVTRALALLTGVGTAATALVAIAGPWLLEVSFGGEYRLGAGTMALLVASAVPTAGLFFTGAALLATNRHGAYVAGWGIAALVGICALIALADHLVIAVAAATAGAPLIGLTVHGVALVARGRRVAPVRESG